MKTCKQSLPCPFEENSPKLLSEEERRCLIDSKILDSNEFPYGLFSK